MGFAAVMFDLDGTLADTLADIAGAGNHTLAHFGRPPLEVARYRYLAGQGARYLVQHALATDDERQIDEALAVFKAYQLEHGLDHTIAYPGIAELLDELARRGLPLAVLSNKSHPATRLAMKRVLGRWKWDAIAGHRPSGPLKPDPAGALAIARELGVAPADWIYIGDTRVDMLTAGAAGMYPVGVLWGFRDEPELRDSGARLIVREPSEVLALLNTVGPAGKISAPG
jgi:phosphoglycolate phosphatase